MPRNIFYSVVQCRRQRMECWSRIAVLAVILNVAFGEFLEVCNAKQNARLRCGLNEIILVGSAQYGRMKLGRCITEPNEFMGCTNDVLPLVDSWCSGLRECELGVPDPELEKLNKNCLKVLIKYLLVEYECLAVNTDCSGSRPTPVIGSEGIISSSTHDNKGCGSSTSPWIISARPGQTINFTIVDFGVEPTSSSLVSCPVVYGYVREKGLGINYTMCNGRRRERTLYSSKTNEVQVQIASRSARGGKQFLLKYEVSGCAELLRPAHAWYKREGNQAIIGCENNDKEWRLTCVGNKWKGEVGNCTTSADLLVVSKVPRQMETDSVVLMTGIACGAVVLCVVAIVTGAVYVKKYRLRQETKHLMKTYATLDKNARVAYGPVDSCAAGSASLDKHTTMTMNSACGPMMSYPETCACASLPSQTGSRDEKQSLYSSIKSS